MSTAATEIEIWELVIHPDGPIPRETAKRLLELDFSEEERREMRELAARNRAGQLSPAQQSRFDAFCRVGTVLAALKSRARQVLKPRRRAS